MALGPGSRNLMEDGRHIDEFDRLCPGRHVANNAVLSFAVVLWAVVLEPEKDSEPVVLDDVGRGVNRYEDTELFARRRY